MNTITKRGLQIFSLLSVTVGVFLGVAPQAQADYRVELDGSYAEGDDAFGDIDDLNLSVRAFLAPVDDSAGPYAEAAFLTRASSLRYRYSRLDRDLDENDGPVFADEDAIKNHEFSGRYVAVDSGWIATGLVAVPVDREGLDTTSDGFRIGAGVGRYIDANSSVEVSVEYVRQDTNFSSNQECGFFAVIVPNCDALLLESDTQADTIGLRLQYRRVGNIANQTFATTIAAGYSNTDFDTDFSQTLLDVDGEEISDFGGGVDVTDNFLAPSVPSVDSWNFVAAGTWYVNRQLGIDAAYTFEKAGSLDVHGVSAGLGWFVLPSIELRAAYTYTFPDLGSNNDLWRLTLRGRF